MAQRESLRLAEGAILHPTEGEREGGEGLLTPSSPEGRC